MNRESAIKLILETRLQSLYIPNHTVTKAFIQFNLSCINAKPYVLYSQRSSQNGSMCLALDNAALVLTNFTIWYTDARLGQLSNTTNIVKIFL